MASSPRTQGGDDADPRVDLGLGDSGRRDPEPTRPIGSEAGEIPLAPETDDGEALPTCPACGAVAPEGVRACTRCRADLDAIGRVEPRRLGDDARIDRRAGAQPLELAPPERRGARRTIAVAPSTLATPEPAGPARTAGSATAARVGVVGRALGWLRGAPAADGGAPRCAGCGYDLRGLASRRCPECGILQPRRAGRGRSREEHAAAEHRSHWRRPWLRIVPGVAICMLLIGLSGGPLWSLGYLVKFAAELPIALAVYLFCCAVWIGWDESIRLTALRLAAVHAVTDAVFLGLELCGIPLVPWLLSAGVYFWRLADELDLEWVDAVIVGMLMVVAKGAVGIALLLLVISLR